MADTNAVLSELRESFGISAAEMKRIIKDFHREMGRGLAGKGGCLKMLPAYVGRPTGREKGSFIALDLGGTNFRVLGLRLHGNGRTTMPAVMKFALHKKHITKDAGELFGFLASSVKAFLRAHKTAPRRDINLGFTFSFPIDQNGIATGSLVTWTKGFEAAGVIGHDVVSLLKKALAKEGLTRIRVTALANDTVGTLMARSYGDRSCDVGVIIGTGTNACYPEKVSKIGKWKGPSDPGSEMIVNIEWGNFNRLRATRYDRQLDRATDNPGKQILEKMVSGMYLGEVARRVIADLAGRQIVFRGQACGRLQVAGSLRSEDVSAIEGDRSPSLAMTGAVLRRLGVQSSCPAERALIRRVCAIVSARAARISAAAMAAVVTKMDPRIERKHTIAVDGSVYEKHPGFAANIKRGLAEALGKRAGRIRLVLSKDGSGKGAAIIAAVAAAGKKGL